MKVKQLLLLSLALFFMFTSCEQPYEKEQSVHEGNFKGNVTVTNGDGEGIDYVRNDVEAELTLNTERQGTCNVLLKKVSFSSKMPVTIDMTIAYINIDQDGNLSGDSIVPWAGLFGEYPKYTIRNLKGKVSYDSEGSPLTLDIDMKCGEYPTKYIGTYIK